MKKDVFDELIVVKRSGQRVNFNGYKIVVAIKNAFDNTKNSYNEKDINSVYENVLKYIEKNYVTRKTINVEDIQDIIENELQSKKYIDVYDEFASYRKKRSESRQAFTIKQQHKFARAMEKITEENLIRIETSFKPFEIILNYGNTVLDEFVKSYVIDNKYLRQHEEGNIYIDSIGRPSIGCVSHTNLMLDNFIENLNSICEITNYLDKARKEIYGEIHIANIDKILSIYYLKKYKDILKSNINKYLKVTGFDSYINVNTIFSIINKSQTICILDKINSFALNEKVKNIFKEAYNDSLTELTDIIRHEIEYFLNKINKLNHKYSFSINENSEDLTHVITNTFLDILIDNQRYDNICLIVKIINIKIDLTKIFEIVKSNKNISIQKSNENDDREYFSNGITIYNNTNDNFYSDGRMVIGETSINMARLALVSSDDNMFYSKLDELLELIKNELLLVFETVGNKNKDNYDLLFDGNINYDEKLESGGKIRKVIKNSILQIGLVGLKECIEILESNDEKKFALLLKIVEYINNKLLKFSEETKINFYAYEPYKNKANYHFMALDKSIYGIRKSVTDKNEYDYVTNLKSIKNDYEKIGTIQNKLLSGCNYIKEIKSNITYKKFLYMLNEMYENNIFIIKFVEEN